MQLDKHLSDKERQKKEKFLHLQEVLNMDNETIPVN